MGVRAGLARLAAAAPAPVFAVTGAGAREAVQDLSRDPRLDVVDSPRRADVLLLAGEVPPGLADAAAAAHDAMSQPRNSVAWTAGASTRPVAGPFVGVDVVDGDSDDVAAAVSDRHRELLRGDRASEPALLLDVDPAPWRGVGPYGQGGTGMTGGVPYGRPMAGRADDRDGLTLDQLPVRLGPLLAPLPPGLTLQVALQGDVVQDVDVEGNPYDGVDAPAPAGLAPFLRAVTEPVPVAELELARACHHLRWLARALAVHGLGALARRVLRVAGGLQPSDGDAVDTLARTVRRTGVQGWATAGVGVASAEALADAGAGPVGRAVGVADDARGDDPAYQELGFEPCIEEGGDAASRWRQRLAECRQSLDLARHAGDTRAGGWGQVESPTGLLESGSSATGRLLALLPTLLRGQEWGDAVTMIVSLDLDLEEAAAARGLAVGEVAR